MTTEAQLLETNAELITAQNELADAKVIAGELLEYKAAVIEASKKRFGKFWDSEFESLPIELLSNLIKETPPKIVTDAGCSGEKPTIRLSKEEMVIAVEMYPHVSRDKALGYYQDNLQATGRITK